MAVIGKSRRHDPSDDGADLLADAAMVSSTRDTSAWKAFRPRQSPATTGRASRFTTGFSDEQERKARSFPKNTSRSPG